MDEFTLDADPMIPTGVPADPDRVAELLADPEVPLTAADVERLPEWQQPTPEQIEAAES